MTYKFRIMCLIGYCCLLMSCKKTEITKSDCSCPSPNTPVEEINSIYNLTANGFFVFKQFYTINSTSVVLDSCYAHATECFSPQQYPGGYVQFFWGDSAKVNGVKFTRFTQTIGLVAPYSNTCFSSPRFCEFYGDSTKMFVDINYLDNTPLPQYVSALSLPDSINISQDSIISIGNRTNMMETEVALKGYLLSPPWEHYHKELKSTETSITVPKQNLLTLGSGYSYLVINVRNWSTIKLKKQTFRFVSDHCYIKKVKLYN